MTRSLPALLSQILVAFTVEFDNEFEWKMRERGYSGARLSLVVWWNPMRFLADGAISVRELSGISPISREKLRLELGCLERWGFMSIEEGPQRKGWGSGRGIRSESRISLTAVGRSAVEIWALLFAGMEERWRTRFGGTIAELRQVLEEMLGGTDPALPLLLWRLLREFAKEFDRESRVPLWLCANTLRVLGEEPLPISEIPRLTGGSPEMCGIGWQIKPYVLVEAAATGRRGKVVSLSAAGILTQRQYEDLVREIEARWEGRFGSEMVRRVRELLLSLFTPALSEGLVPRPGTVRAGENIPALGRRDIGAAAKQRRLDLIAQTEMFVRDPAGSLPHYPCWDMNRGFGP